MEVDCEGCAGCCLDWRPLSETPSTHERGGPGEPLDDSYNLVPLTREDVRAFLDAGLADALRPRLWTVESGGVTVDGVHLAALDGRPVFYVGLRTPPKPVAPFGTAPRWLATCVFLDPRTLQCRVHESDVYPTECADYPGHNLALDAETECERVEAETGEQRLLDGEAPDDLGPSPIGPGAVGHRLFVLPGIEPIKGRVSALASGTLSAEDRATFVAVAAASSPGTTTIDEERFQAVRERARDADSWVSDAVDVWRSLADGTDPVPARARSVEDARGAPGTPGWD